MARDNAGIQNIAFALVGAALGAAVGLLAAPSSGEETRRRLTRRFEEETDALLRQGERVVNGLSHVLDRRIA
jgi:gas vesicle protein